MLDWAERVFLPSGSEKNRVNGGICRKTRDERGHTHQQIEQGYSVDEVRDRFAAQGYLVHWVKPQGLLYGAFGMGSPALISVRNCGYKQKRICLGDCAGAPSEGSIEPTPAA